MAAPKIKATYTLDAETIKLIERLAKKWKTSKSEALRRAIRESPATRYTALDDPKAWIEKFKELQRSMNLSEAGARKWQRENRAMRRAGSRHRGF